MNGVLYELIVDKEQVTKKMSLFFDPVPGPLEVNNNSDVSDVCMFII